VSNRPAGAGAEKPKGPSQQFRCLWFCGQGGAQVVLLGTHRCLVSQRGRDLPEMPDSAQCHAYPATPQRPALVEDTHVVLYSICCAAVF
jgi:hypothetical protein